MRRGGLRESGQIASRDAALRARQEAAYRRWEQMPPLVSLIINNYNYGKYLPRCLETALAQTWAETEVIVVDDASTDDSREVISRYPGARPVLKPSTGGQASALNAG